MSLVFISYRDLAAA